jgi:5'-phosphate synthase pdxT subunit
MDLGEGMTKEEAVFIRAPKISRCGDDCDVVAMQNGDPVVVRQGKLLATTFHPELSDGMAFHRYFLSLVP